MSSHRDINRVTKMIINFALARVIRFNTNKLNMSQTANDNIESRFFTDIVYDIQEMFVMKEQDQWTYTMDFVFKNGDETL